MSLESPDIHVNIGYDPSGRSANFAQDTFEIFPAQLQTEGIVLLVLEMIQRHKEYNQTEARPSYNARKTEGIVLLVLEMIQRHKEYNQTEARPRRG